MVGLTQQGLFAIKIVETLDATTNGSLYPNRVGLFRNMEDIMTVAMQ